MWTRLTAMAWVLCALMALVACGTTGSDKAAPSSTGRTITSAPTTEAATTTGPATTEPATTTRSDPGGTTTPGNLGPSGDERLLPLLLEPADFGPGFTYDDSSDGFADKEFCDGVSFTTDWQATATMGAKSSGTKQSAGTSEGILSFDSGQAAAFVTEFAALTKVCAAKDHANQVTLVPLEGFGDGGFRTPPATVAGRATIEIVIVRTGDYVIVLFGLAGVTPLLTDAVINSAIAKVRAG